MFRAIRYRVWWIVPAVLALAASLLIGPADPADAVDGVADHPADYSACIGPATESAGFLDMRGSFAEAAADCLAYYGITKGTSAGIFSPNDVIPRWQMALFLARATGPAGIVVPKASDQGFTDLDLLGPHTRDAINQLAALSIMQGTSATTFSPFADVTRQQMALLLSRFLAAAPVGPGGADIVRIESDDDNFQDLDSVSVTTYRAIRKLYESGVTTGTSASTFSPDGRVSRGQMAVFIARMLAHTNARPAGLTVQTTTAEVFENSDVRLSVTLRDPTHQPFEDREVDIFTATDPAKAFDQNGACTDHVAPALGISACTIDGSDKTTDTLGNVEADIEVGDAEGLRIWVWTDKSGKSFDEDSSEPVVIDITTRSGATALEISDDLPPTAMKAQFGDSVTFTFRMIDDDGDPIARSGVSFTLQVRESRDNGRSFEPTTISKQTGPDGGTQLTFRFTDLSPDPGDIAKLDLDIRNSSGFKVEDETTIGMVEDDRSGNDPFLDWADERAEPTTLELSLTKEYRTASADGDGAASTVRAGLTDQYGGPVGRENIVFTSNDRNGVPNGVRRATNRQGVASLNYLRDFAGRGVETITARFDRLSTTARQYWIAPISGAASGSGSVRVVDTDNNTIVVADGNDAVLIEYDGNDHYRVDAEPVTVANFEGRLTVGDTLAYEITGPGKAVVNTFTLTDR